MTTATAKITPNIIADHGLTGEEYQLVLEIMGREPTITELGIFSVMWSEHCSYKSSRVHLKKLPTKAPWVIQGPGENAGVIDIGDGQAAIFKMESHNHPSFIEPYQGAATGVGGIMRDVFTMGARPIANVNALRFGEPDDPKTRHLIAGVVAGIGGYGNCMGVPTVAGEVNFHASYNGNILVNAMTVGLAPADKIFYSAAAGVGNPVIYVGAKTGRDGIHGATMASAEFTEDSEEKRPTVQVGDPFTEKLLLEACLELMATDAIVAIQDMGAAGLTSSSVEMSSKGGLGIELDLDKVPVRETHMTAYEIMLSESQERMLMILKPEAMDKARAIFEKWELDFAEIGRLTDTGHLVLKKNGKVEADMPVAPLVEKSPVYQRPYVPTKPQEDIDPASVPAPSDLLAALRTLVGSADLSSRRWVWEQYDHLIMGNTMQRPGGDAAVVRLPDANGKALAITSDCTPRYCFADPKRGGAQAVAETWRNLTAVGATPLAITDNMNFGNPQRPEIMGQFVGCIEGMAEACRALDYPVISGNVSLYNETNGKGILPTPVIGGVGVIADAAKSALIAFRQPGEVILLVGETTGHVGQSIYLRELHGREEGAPPPIDLAAEKRNGDFIRTQILAGNVTACHDCSDGGLLVAIAEMAMAGDLGATLRAPEKLSMPAHAFWFGEDQARYVATVTMGDADRFLNEAKKAGVPVTVLGETGSASLTLVDNGTISVADLKGAHEAFFPDLMSAGS
ncbi:phosphoribosylformylglycinamidine synthase subunit PurL [Dongia deserti]|uniref:phosphoribosylformylglycinamidine synthase subunit PurL n=1 Tax=Dongia deserti TaxID=2268030 RepID=UPI0025481BC9|nr:phosphoribosylformylglycinamidine synthase subunit PurL [Dongia deserti]